MPETARHFLFLQGPRGPLFERLARQLAARGANVRRVLFTTSDRADWPSDLPASKFSEPLAAFKNWLSADVIAHQVTDLVLFGDVQEAHRHALELAEDDGVTVHILGEGYLHPDFVTYERGGAQEFGELTEATMAEMADLVEPQESRRGDFVPACRADIVRKWWLETRDLSRQLTDRSGFENSSKYWWLFRLHAVAMHLAAGLLAPLRVCLGRTRKAWVLRSGRVYHLILLGAVSERHLKALPDRDAALAFVERAFTGFRASCAPDELLVVKLEPLDADRVRLGNDISILARSHQISSQVVLIDAGRVMTDLIDESRTVLTPEPAEADHVLRRGWPVACDPVSVFGQLGLGSDQDLAAFLRAPARPDRTRYWLLRRFLTSTSQLAGSCYAPSGLRRLLALLPDAMLAQEDPYSACYRRAEERLADAAFSAPPGASSRRIRHERLH
ncbi:MAG: hypothetical protein AAGC81_15085 [Pseudomonadota bacterium]